MKPLIILTTILYSISAFAYEPERAKTNQAHELADCVAFYLLGAEAVRRNGATELAETLSQSAILAMNLSEKLSNKKTLKARVNMSVTSQQKMINNNFSNISILLQKYGENCKSATETPNARYQYWLTR